MTFRKYSRTRQLDFALMYVLAVFVALVCVFCALDAKGQTQGPIDTSQVNRTIYVGTGGGFYKTIQGAVTKACTMAGARVNIPPGVTPADSIATVSGGCTTVSIDDARTTPITSYVWNGTVYTQVYYAGTIPATSIVLKGNGAGSAIAANPTDVTNLLKGLAGCTNTGYVVSPASGLCIQAGGVIPATNTILKGNGTSGVSTPATGTDVVNLLQNLTGCTTAGYVISPATGQCVAAGGAPAGSTLQLQFNNSGTFGGSQITTDNATHRNITVPGSVSAGALLGSQTATGNGSIPGALAACTGIPCDVTIDAPYNRTYANDQSYGYPYFGANYGFLTKVPIYTHVHDESNVGSGLDFIAEGNNGINHHKVFQHSITLYRPIQVQMTRVSNLVTITGFSDRRWCSAGFVITGSPNSTFNSTLKDAVGNYQQTNAASCTGSGTGTTITTYVGTGGADVTTAVTGIITAYENIDVANWTSHIAAGGGWYGIGTETSAQAQNVSFLATRMGLNHAYGLDALGMTTGDWEGKYEYCTLHQQGGGNPDDEDSYCHGFTSTESSNVAVFSVTSLRASNNQFYVSQIVGDGGVFAGGGHLLLQTKKGDGTDAQVYAGNRLAVQGVDVAPPSDMADMKVLLLDSSGPGVAQSTAWGTFTAIDTPPTEDYGVKMSTTLTAAASSPGQPQSVPTCFVTQDRTERVTDIVMNGNVATGTFRQYLKPYILAGSGTLKWFQGPGCTAPGGGGLAAKLGGTTYVAGQGGEANVLRFVGAFDAYHLVYANNGNGGLRSLRETARNLEIETFTTGMVRDSTGLVNVYNVGNSVNYNIINWCGRTVTVTGETGGDTSLNGTHVFSCNNPLGSGGGGNGNGNYTFQSTASAPISVTATSTSDLGRENLTIYPMAVVINTVDETAVPATPGVMASGCLRLDCFVETEKTDWNVPAGATLEDHVGLHTTMYLGTDSMTCWTAGCHGNVHSFGGTGLRGQNDLNGFGFCAECYGNGQALSTYQPWGGDFIPPTLFLVGGAWQTIMDLGWIYGGGNAIAPGGRFLHMGCPEHIDGTGACQSAQDDWSLVEWGNSVSGDAQYGGNPAKIVMRPLADAIDLNMGKGVVYSFGWKNWSMGQVSGSSGVLSGIIHGNVTFTDATGPVTFNNGLTSVPGTTITGETITTQHFTSAQDATIGGLGFSAGSSTITGIHDISIVGALTAQAQVIAQDGLYFNSANTEWHRLGWNGNGYFTHRTATSLGGTYAEENIGFKSTLVSGGVGFTTGVNLSTSGVSIDTWLRRSSAGALGVSTSETGGTVDRFCSVANPCSGGTVTSVGLALPTALFASTVSGSPVTSSGTFTPTLATQSANTILAGPASGSAATPTFRALTAADVPLSTDGIVLDGQDPYLVASDAPIFHVVTAGSGTIQLLPYGGVSPSPNLWQQVNIVNTNATSVTVTSNLVIGNTGTATSVTLAAGATGRYVYDGAAWRVE